MVLTMDQRQQRPRREAQACARGDRASNSLILDELVELPCRDSQLNPTDDEAARLYRMSATIERLLHHAHVITTEGTSLRLTEATGREVVPLN